LETAISWGRYAELFDFDAARRRFIEPELHTEPADTPGAKVDDAPDSDPETGE